MKKLTGILMAVCLTAALIAGCGQKAGKTTDTGAVEHRESAVKLQDTGEERTRRPLATSQQRRQRVRQRAIKGKQVI